MMRHYVLTSSSFGPTYPADSNRRRLAMLRGVTARSLASQPGGWTWIVRVHRDDPFLDERLAAFGSAGHEVLPSFDDPAEGIDWSSDVLTTRIDDDDAFARDAFRRLYGAVSRLRRRTVLMFPVGYRVNGGLYMPIPHAPHNAWSSLYAPAGDRTHVRMRQHHHVGELAPITFVDRRPAFLWVRHPDTNSPFRSAIHPLTDRVRGLFDVDWPLVESVGGPWPGRPGERAA